MKNYILIGVLAILLIVLMFSIKTCSDRNTENKRLNENFEQLQKSNQELNLNLSEFKELSGRDKTKIDSLFKQLKLKPRTVKEVTVVNTVYRDTGTFKVIYKDVIKQDSGFKVPVSYESNCWGLKGEIVTKDKDSKFIVLEKSAGNSLQLVVKRPRKFLFWTIRKEQFNVYSDCGEAQFTKIVFVR